MITQLADSLKKLDDLAYGFASKHRLDLDDLVFDDGIFMLKNEMHSIEIRSNGQKVRVNLSTDDIVTFSIKAQHKIIMALMNFVPLAETSPQLEKQAIKAGC